MAFYKRGNAYRAKGDNDRAILDYNQALSIDPNYVSVYNNRAVAYFNKGDYDSAIADYNQAIAIDPKHLYAYIGRSEAYGQKKDYGQAIADLNKAIALESEDAARSTAAAGITPSWVSIRLRWPTAISRWRFSRTTPRLTAAALSI